MIQTGFRNSKGFTMIELLVVMGIILVLAGMLIPKIIRSKESTSRTLCVHNIKNLTQALCLYTSMSEGFLKKASIGQKAHEVYGALFQKNGWNDLQNLVCPSHHSAVPPKPAGYGKPLNRTDAAIDYWIVFPGNTFNRVENTSTFSEINTLSAPGENTLVIESFTVDGTWSQSDFHHEGGTIGHVNGRAEFVNSFPANEMDDGSNAPAITKSQCSW
ncbi:MAG: type II secretion system protein [Candidatus Aureabacteria bacterium]|nr:type II secretion system protein [Candidatus Auribacterota bacterium]